MPSLARSRVRLDGETELRTAGHEYTSQADDYYDLPRDGTPQHPRSG
jgi:hypothetical protein